jgi:hypothetical protein
MMETIHHSPLTLTLTLTIYHLPFTILILTHPLPSHVRDAPRPCTDLRMRPFED